MRISYILPNFIVFLLVNIASSSVFSQEVGFGSCMPQLRAHAISKGINPTLFDKIMHNLSPEKRIIEAMETQPEFKTPIWDYLATLNDQQKVVQGKAMLKKYSDLLSQVEEAYGVDKYTIVAVWGVESDYGRAKARWGLPQALATAACYGSRRQDFFRNELVSALKIVQNGDIEAKELRGSWAGAFGHTQFIPSTYLKFAVDFDGDGKRDLVSSIPDALASTANYIAKSGWLAGEKWGYEVAIPQDYNGLSGRKQKETVEFWNNKGIRRVDGGQLINLPPSGLLLPAGKYGPTFLVTKNFDAVYAYNAAESYALAISVLSDLLRGQGGIKAPWPTEDRGLTRAERKELQERLQKAGYDIGEPNGDIGAKTRAAIRDAEKQMGLPETGRPGGKLLDLLR